MDSGLHRCLVQFAVAMDDLALPFFGDPKYLEKVKSNDRARQFHARYQLIYGLLWCLAIVGQVVTSLCCYFGPLVDVGD